MQNIKQLDDRLFEVRITYPDALTGSIRTVRRRVHGSVSDARLARAELNDQIADGTVQTAKTSSKTIEDWTDEYLARARLRLAATSFESERRNILRVVQDVGIWNPAAITVLDLDRVTEGWAKLTKDDGSLLSKATVRHYVGALKRLLKFVLRKIQGDLSLLLHLESPEMGTRPTRQGTALTACEAGKFLKDMKATYPQYYALIYMLVVTGQRFGSVSALRWQDVEDGWIVFAQSQFRGTVKEGNKTGKVVRLPLTKDLLRVLQWHRERMVKMQHPNLAMDLVFPTCKPADETPGRGYLYASSLTKPFNNVCSSIGVGRITPHDLRRTFNSIQVEAGTSGTILRSITSHSSTAMTDRYYFGSRAAKETALSTMTELIR